MFRLFFVDGACVQTCMAAEECNTLDFDAASDMWFGGSDNLFSCPENHGEGLFEGGDGVAMSPVTYVGTFLKVRQPDTWTVNNSYLGLVCGGVAVPRRLFFRFL